MQNNMISIAIIAIIEAIVVIKSVREHKTQIKIRKRPCD